MKDKNKKGLFSIFQNVIHSVDSSEDDNIPSAKSPEESVNDAIEDAVNDVIEDAVNDFVEDAVNDVVEDTVNDTVEDTSSNTDTQDNSAVAPSETSPPVTEPASIWEPSDDPLLDRIDEEILQIECNQFTSKMRSLSAVIKRTAAAQQEPQPKAAQPQLYISKNRMAAWFYVIPPLNDGQDINEGDLKTFLAQEHVTTGILEDVLKSIAENLIYDQSVLIAKGTLARNGIDGTVKDLYERILQLEFEEDEKGSVDYKNLNNIQSVKEGEVICEITPAVPGENGLTIDGKPFPCTVKGTDVPIPSGRNTVLTEDRTLLISQKTGHVTFVNGKFNIDSVLKINGNIDNSTGNLDYDGDILISGDVMNGFSVKATGRVDIRGSVEGAQITAHGPITIASGMSGNGRGILTSDSDVKCRYLEHCIVSAGGSVYAESIINSKIESSQDIMVTSGIGVIIGGSLMAANNIQAKIIGSKTRRLVTELVIANIPRSVEEASQLTRELEQLHHNISEIRKNIVYLETSQRQDKQQLLDKLTQASEYLNIREQDITNRLNELAADEQAENGLIQCQLLLPVVRIRIGSSSLLVQEEYSSSIIYRNSESDIIIGTN